MLGEMSPMEFAKRSETDPAPVLLDVREDWELAISRIDAAVHIPMGEIPSCFRELEPDRDIVVMCRSGGRSAVVARFLLQQGYPRVWNLSGGILAWSEQVDPALPTY